MDPGVNLAAYPLHQPKSPAYAALVADCRQRLAEQGMFELPDFLLPEVTKAAAEAVAPAMATQAFRHARKHNIYFRDRVDGLPPNHPALAMVETVNHTLCADQIADNPVMALYEWQPFADFLAATMDKAALYRMEDPLARVNVQASRTGEALNWHFDRSEFTTTILLQEPQAGGELEYRTNLRTADQPNYDGVAALLRGEDPAVRKVRLQAGALNVFRGVNTLHRVVPVQGPRERIVTIFAFFDRPGVSMTAAEQLGFYGRSAAC